MNSLMWKRLAGALLGVALMATGCGEPVEKVDLNAQLGNLSGDADTKISALAEIAKMGAEAASAVPRIVPLLDDEDPIVRRTAAYTLGTIGPDAKAAVPKLREMMRTNDRDQATAVANALRAIEPATVGDLRIENVAN
ncbi:MAG: HEAT repeat domain-containing protein [Verrucomicrobiae bacterium]|nr:HEAT repeat domain-containing protein [Verrucomicrobiae bacterium]